MSDHRKAKMSANDATFDLSADALDEDRPVDLDDVDSQSIQPIQNNRGSSAREPAAGRHEHGSAPTIAPDDIAAIERAFADMTRVSELAPGSVVRQTLMNDDPDPVIASGFVSGAVRVDPQVPFDRGMGPEVTTVQEDRRLRDVEHPAIGRISHQPHEPHRPDAPPPASHSIVLRLDAVVCDPADNATRLGRPYLPDDHDLLLLMETIRREGVIHPPEVRRLTDPPDVRVEDGLPSIRQTHRVVSGFGRFTAMRMLGWKEGRFTEVVDMDDDRALIHNGIENFGRKNPSDYDLAVYVAMLARRHREWDSAEIAARIGAKRGRVDELLRIVFLLPPDLLDVFSRTPTDEVRRTLARVSMITRPTKTETHQAMVDEWARIKSERQAADLLKEEKKAAKRDPAAVAQRAMPRASIDTLRQEQRVVERWFDPVREEYVPVTDEMRAYADALLRHVGAPKTRSPLR